MLKHIGVRGRLLLAFLGISAFVVLAAAAGVYSVLKVGEALDGITRDRVPAAVALLQLAAESERIVAISPTLLAVRSKAEHEAVLARIGNEAERLSEFVREVRDSPMQAGALEQLAVLVDGLRRNLETLSALVSARLEMSERKSGLLQRLADTNAAVQRLLGPAAKLLDAKRAQLEQTIAAGDPSLLSDARAVRVAREVTRFLPQQRAHAEALAINDGLLRTASASKEADLTLLAPPLYQSLQALRQLAGVFERPLGPPLRLLVEQLAGLIDGPDSILAIQQAEFDHIANAQRLIAENAQLSKELTSSVAGLVEGAKQAIAEANHHALSVQRSGMGVLAAIVFLSLASSGLIVWLYVDRNLLARLTVLSDSMLAIARGDLQTLIPTGGRDEIARMAEALAVFRNTAVEVEEKNLRTVAEARQRLIDAIESISEGFALFDAEDRLVLSNSRFRQDFYPGLQDLMVPGMPFETILGQAVARSLVGEARRDPEGWIRMRLEAHRNPGEVPLIHRVGERWIQVSERRIREGGSVAVYTDVTELKCREVELAELVRKLELARDQAMEATRAKSVFLANMSHELRTPLNAIIGFTRLVMRRSKDVLPAKQYENLEKILISGEHLLSLINAVLDLSKIEAGRVEVRPVEFTLEPLLDLCLRTVEPMLRGDRVILTKEVEPGLPTLVQDHEKVRQILTNLLGNAAKFTEAGSITIRTCCDGEEVVVEVSDTGIGIPDQARELIFEEFRQVDSGSTRQHGGTGLGLAISRRLARLMGGDITVESALGTGSTFTLRLPLSHGTTPSASRPAETAVGQDTREEAATGGRASASAEVADDGPTVLVIDDDPNVIELLRENLAEAGYRVVGARDGEEGINKARALRPDSIVLDIIMPRKDGWQVLHELKADPSTRDIPIVLLSVVDQKNLGYRLGAADYLVKPFEREALLTTLSRTAGHCGRLLVVDDDPNVADMVRQLLEGEACTIDVARDGREALRAIAERPPDAVLLDLLMPGLDGFAVLEQLQADPGRRDIPVIVLTAKELTPEESALLERRTLAVVEKRGLERNALLQEVRRALSAVRQPEPEKRL